MESAPVNPCHPSPCGPNSQCREVNGNPSCSCIPEFIGNPPNCRPECVSNFECSDHLACINNKCKDPCPGTCGQNADCRVISHTPNCQCQVGYTGDPFRLCFKKRMLLFDNCLKREFKTKIYKKLSHFTAEDTPVERLQPCVPSPCGANAICRERNGIGACSCIEDYTGNPYESCRPECVISTDCPSNKACIKNKCEDPCPGTCGQNADCQVINHLANCICREGYTGDPFRHCSFILKR